MPSERYTELGFDDTKANIIAHLKSKPEFTDYNFTGSNSNILIDALAYVTTYIGKYSNMSISEIFMMTAQLRNSVVSRAKALSYMPRQINSSVAIVSMRVPVPVGFSGNVLVVPRGTRFNSTLNNISYNFVVADDTRLILEDGYLTNSAVTIRQGSLQIQEWTFKTGSAQRYILTQPNVDVNFLKLEIQDSAASSVTESWLLYDEITAITRETKAFFMQEAEDQRVEVYFGDGVIGRRINNGNIIRVEYLVTKGAEANLCNKFELISDVKGIPKSQFVITTVEASNSGAESESIDSIKLNAPNAFATQKRAVTTTDFESLLNSKYGAIQTMNIWGGEKNVPPEFGKVFVCIKPTFGLELSPAVKQRIYNTILKKYSIVGIVPVIVDADYTYVNVTTVLDTDMSKTTMIEGQLITEVANKIALYFTSELNKFNTSFKYSNISAKIDAVSPAVLSNKSTLTISKKMKPVAGKQQTYSFNFNNPIIAGTLASKPYSNDDGLTNSVVKDDGKGNMLYFYKDVMVRQVGTVNYSTGLVTLTSFTFELRANTEVEFVAKPQETDILSVRNNLVIVGDVDVQIPEHIVVQ